MYKYIFILLSILFSGDFLPENNQSVNYTQVFFRWPQVEELDNYQIKIFEDSTDEEVFSTSCESNSYFLDNFLMWGTSYSWKVCSLDSDECPYENYFTINPLPINHPSDVEVLHLDETYYQEGINILDFESLLYSLALDRYGNIIWFADRNNFQDSKIISGELLRNGNFTGFSSGTGYEFSINSDIVFESLEEFNVHHQITKTDNDTYFIIDAEIQYHPCPEECDAEFSIFPVPWQGDRFIELNKNNEILWEWNTFDQINLEVPITCSHLSSMALMEPYHLRALADRLAYHQVNVVALPLTNLWLLSRDETCSLLKRPLAPIKQLQKAGVTVAIGGDNVQDAWFPAGNFDPLALMSASMPITHAAPWNRLGLSLFTTSAARLMGLEWDGTFKGEHLNPQVFDFFLELECIGEKKMFYKGNITLIR